MEDALLPTLAHWHWWIAGTLFMVAELLLPGLFLLWIGGAAWIVGVIVLLTGGMAPQWQLMLFAVLMISVVILARYMRNKSQLETDQPLLNERYQSLIGQRHYLSEPVVHGRGRVQIADSSWSIKGPDMDAGQYIEVVAVEGVVLVVKPVQEDAPAKADASEVGKKD